MILTDEEMDFARSLSVKVVEALYQDFAKAIMDIDYGPEDTTEFLNIEELKKEMVRLYASGYLMGRFESSC